MKKWIYIPLILLGISCSDEPDLLVPIPNDITFNNIELERYTHVIPENGFDAGGLHFNTVKESEESYSGFAYSRRSNRSLTFTGTQQAIDSNRFSVYTPYPNQTEVYAVACVKDNNAFFTLPQPSVVEHILVANTTWSYYAMYYGAQTEEIANPNIPAAPVGIWNTYAPGVERPLNEEGDYFKLIITGFLNEQQTGSIDFYLCCRENGDPENPDYDFLRGDWIKADLTPLGTVDKVLFDIECSLSDNSGNSLIPPYFCLDGIRIK